MSIVTEKVLEAAACRIALHVGCGDPSDFRDCNRKTCDCRAAASDALSAVAPMIAAQERERCAKAADMYAADPDECETRREEAMAIAAAIRALGDAT
jgi:hypothetical protein